MSFALFTVVFVLLFLLILGSPVVFAIGASGLSYFLVKPEMISLISIIPHRFFTGMDSFIFLCIPFFMLAGELMSQVGMMDQLVRFAQLVVGRLEGGLAYTNVLASMLFGGISGSALADVAALGPVEIGLMTKDGYSPEFSAALTATSSIQGPIIPPSIPMVIFSSLTYASIGGLFLGGLIPGILIGIGQMIVVYIMSKKGNFPKRTEKIGFKESINICKTAIPALLMPLIIIGGIITGVVTATEASVLSVFYTAIVGIFYYKKLTASMVLDALKKTVKLTSSIYLIIAFTSIIGWIFAIERVPTIIQGIVEDNNLSVYQLFFFVNIFFLFNGMWISDVVQLVLFAPIFTPIFASLGIHPIHFGVVMVVNVMLGMITPPYGTALYLAAEIGGVQLKDLVRETIPFTIVSILVLFLITYFPPIILFVPRLFGFL